MSKEEIRALIQAEVEKAIEVLRKDLENQIYDLRDELKETGGYDPNW
jgi:hypothetical protein